MFLLLVILVFGFGFAYFAATNSVGVDVNLVLYSFEKAPLYLVVLGSLVLGIFIAWLINVTGLVSSKLSLRKKEGKLKESEKEIAELTQKVHKLVLENNRLKKKLGRKVDDKSI